MACRLSCLGFGRSVSACVGNKKSKQIIPCSQLPSLLSSRIVSKPQAQHVRPNSRSRRKCICEGEKLKAFSPNFSTSSFSRDREAQKLVSGSQTIMYEMLLVREVAFICAQTDNLYDTQRAYRHLNANTARGRLSKAFPNAEHTVSCWGSVISTSRT